MNWQAALSPEIKHDELLGIPYAARDPLAYKTALSFDAYGILFGLNSLVKDLEQQSGAPDLTRLTRDRLKNLRASYEEQIRILAALFRPLEFQNIPFAECQAYLSQRRPHILTRHHAHLFRDWSWGENEIAQSLELVKREHAAALGDVENVLVLGAGACRFPYELHRLIKPKYTLCLDINPMLLACAEKVVHGQTMKMVEFPTVPKQSDLFATMCELRAPEAIATGEFEFLIHDVEEWAFKEKSFDLVVTPWFIDVVPMATPRLLSLINNVLRDGGRWLNQGPIGFNRRILSEYLSREELLQLVGKSGFAVPQFDFSPVPYFQHPHSGHWRIEHVLTFLAKKETHLSAQRRAEPPMLPWIKDPTKPIEISLSLAELQRSLQFSVELLEKLAATPQISIRELASAMTQRYGLSSAQAEYLISRTLYQWQDLNRYNPLKS